jgi:hypothetical protein
MDKPTTPVTAARKITRMIGQEEAVAQVEAAISAPGKQFRVVFIRAQGGMGKTRLLEEVIDRHRQSNGTAIIANNKPSHDALISDLIDVIDIRLHDRERFIQRLRRSFEYLDSDFFQQYDKTFDELVVKRASGAIYKDLEEASQHANEAFLADLRKITRTHRLVWLVDTVEQLSFVTSRWLLDKGLLEPGDLEGRTYQWLANLLQDKELKNMTLLLAGRGREGELFFTAMEEAIRMAGVQRDLVEISLETFSEEETRQYFEVLAGDLDKAMQDMVGDELLRTQRIARNLAEVARSDEERYRVLWLYTEGVPVRLALYAQLIVEGRKIPEPLRQSFAEAAERVGTDDPARETPQLRQIQWEIEDDFINLLFSPGDPRTEILQVLVRAPRGLTAEQIHYAMDSQSEQKPDEWHADHQRLNEITKTLLDMTDYYLVKRRAPLTGLSKLLPKERRESATYRLGLQDEIYRIYAEHMAPQADPLQEEMKKIWSDLDEVDRQRYEENRAYEKEEREILYSKLYDWANHQLTEYRGKRWQYMIEDERQFETDLVLDNPRTIYFRDLSPSEIERREAIAEAIASFEIERSVYDVLLDPERNFNNSDLASETNKANRVAEDFWSQTEIWRIIFDDALLKFRDFAMRSAIKKRGETPIDTLRRAVVQEDVSRWIKRLVFRGESERAIAFADALEKVLQALPRQTPQEEHEWHSWNHSLTRAERQIWRLYAQILASKDPLGAIQSMEFQIEQLKKLYGGSVEDVVIVREDGYEERGFQGVPDKEIPPHPADVRLRRLISHAYNILGYGAVMAGKIRQSVKAYGLSLYYIREDPNLMRAHRATVLNNLSRALSELGHPSVAVCLDGLKMRQQLADEVPLAYSYNTLALIYDNLGVSEDAPMLAAKAIAYFRRAEFPRGLGLGLLQLGESLRHVAKRAIVGESLLTKPENLYATADKLLTEANLIFSESVDEEARLIETKIELGSLYRDRLHMLEYDDDFYQRYNRDALRYLTEARQRAAKKGLLHYEIDAGVNMVWTHFYAGHLAEAEKTAKALVKRIRTKRGDDYLITKDHSPEPDTGPMWIYLQMSKLQMSFGWFAANRFQDIVERERQAIPDNRTKRHIAVHRSKAAQRALSQMAEAYMLGLAYAWVYSPRGGPVNQVLDDLYDRVKGFNQHELDDLDQHIIALEKPYPQQQNIVDMLHQFLHEFFGLPDHD